MAYYRPILVREQDAAAVEQFAANLAEERDAETDTGTDDTLTFRQFP